MSNKIFLTTTIVFFVASVVLGSYCIDLRINGSKKTTVSDSSSVDYDADSMEDVEALKEAGKPMIVVFGADYCNICVNYKPYVKELNSLYGDRITVKFVDSRKHESVRSDYNIEFIPTTLFYAADGSVFFPSDEIQVTPSEEKTDEPKYVSDVFTAKTGEEIGRNTNYEYGVDESGEIGYCKFVGLLNLTQLTQIAEEMLAD
jgi:thiol-disulfide isomerase/thioredoxin